MYLSRIITSRCIAVKWYLRVYWLLPLSIVASFKKHRRFFCRAPTTLLLSTMNTWASQSTSFPKGVISCFHRTLFLFINWISRQLDRSHTDSTDTCQQDPPVFVDKTVISDMLNSRVLLGRAKICACSLGWRASMKRSLSLDWHPATRKETIAGFTLPVTSRPTWKSADPLFSRCLLFWAMNLNKNRVAPWTSNERRN